MPRVVALVPDLMDRSRLSAALGDGVRFVATPAAAAAALAEVLAPGDGRTAAVAIIDLDRPGAVAAVADLRAAGPHRLIGFGAHVDRDTLAAARLAGCDEVLPRSAFFARLADVVG